MLTGKGFWTSAYKRFTHSTNVAGIQPTLQNITFYPSTNVYIISSGGAFADIDIYVGDETIPGNPKYRGFVKFNTSSINPASLVSASLTLTVSADLSIHDRTLSVYRPLRNIVYSEANWSVYSTGNNWGTAGCGNSTSDYNSNALGSIAVVQAPGIGTKYVITLDTNIVLQIIKGELPNYGFFLMVDTEVDDALAYYGFDATDARKPLLSLSYY